jgi:hypothetical protein
MSLPLPNPSQAQIAQALEELRVVELEDEIFEMGRGRLRRHFSHKNGSLHESRLLVSLIWQDLGLLRRAQLAPFTGNIRSYWYARAKPVLSRAGASASDLKTTLYSNMISQFSAMVGERRLFAYREFGFADSSAHLRRLGSDNPHVVVVAEKEGQLVLLRKLERLFGCTTIALGGQPSILATEYFTEALFEAGLGQERLLVLMLVDFDPAGDSIANAFLNQMRSVGFEGELVRHDIAVPGRMTMEQMRLNRYALGRSRRQKEKTRRWIARTGGLATVNERWKNYGLEADAMTEGQVLGALLELTAGQLWVPADEIHRRRLKTELASVLQEMLLGRILGRL